MGMDGRSRRDKPSPEQHTAPNLPCACEQGSLPPCLPHCGLAGCPTGAAALSPEPSFVGNFLHYGGAHQLCGLLGEESTQCCLHNPACTQRHPPASPAPRLGLGKEVSTGGEVSPPPQGSAPPPRGGALALQTCTGLRWEGDDTKSFLG